MNITDEFRFTIRHEDGWWTAVNDDLGIVTQGRTVPRLINRIREALAVTLKDELDVDEVETSSLRLLLRLDQADADAAVQAALEARARAEAASEQAVIQARVAAKLLTDQGYSMRDVAAVLGLSPQRIHRIIGGS